MTLEDSRHALDDSLTALRQGNNIRILNLITTAHLALGFISARNNKTKIPDSLPEEITCARRCSHSATASSLENLGLGTYLWLLLVFLVTTFGVAFSLG